MKFAGLAATGAGRRGQAPRSYPVRRKVDLRRWWVGGGANAGVGRAAGVGAGDGDVEAWRLVEGLKDAAAREGIAARNHRR